MPNYFEVRFMKDLLPEQILEFDNISPIIDLYSRQLLGIPSPHPRHHNERFLLDESLWKRAVAEKYDIEPDILEQLFFPLRKEDIPSWFDLYQFLNNNPDDDLFRFMFYLLPNDTFMDATQLALTNGYSNLALQFGRMAVDQDIYDDTSASQAAENYQGHDEEIFYELGGVLEELGYYAGIY